MERFQMSSCGRAAFVRAVPSTLSKAVLAPGVAACEINVELAKKQHAEYVKLLRRHLSEVYELCAVNECPDSVFVEDAAVVHNGKALQGVAGHPSRCAEISLLTPALVERGIKVEKVILRMDGGDILFVDGHFFVGISERTEAGTVEALSACFGCEAIPVVVGKGTLHLKCVVTWVSGARLLVVQNSHVGHSVLKQMRESVKDANWCLGWVPENATQGANVVDLGQSVLLQKAAWEDLVDVRNVLKDANIVAVPCDMSELMKANGALTCCSILV